MLTKLSLLLLAGSAQGLRILNSQNPRNIQLEHGMSKDQVAELHPRNIEMASASYMNEFSTKCSMSVDADSKTWNMKTEEFGELTMSNFKFSHTNGSTIGDTPPKPMICEVETGAEGVGPGIFISTNGASYLNMKMSKGQKQFKENKWTHWDVMMNKVCWAKRHKVKLFVWIGSVSKDITKKDLDAHKCTETGNPGNHYFIPLGLHGVLEDRKDVTYLVDMDLSDAFFPVKYSNVNLLDTYLTEENGDFITGAHALTKGGARCWINGAIIGFKNTDWTLRLLDKWFKNRCGPKNQLGLWSSLLQLFKEEDPSFTYSEKVLSRYHTAWTYATREAMPFSNDPAAWQNYRETGRLSKTVHFGKHVTILPNADKNGEWQADKIDPEFHAFRAVYGKEADSFMCHMKGYHPDGCSSKLNVCTGDQCTC